MAEQAILSAISGLKDGIDGLGHRLDQAEQRLNQRIEGLDDKISAVGRQLNQKIEHEISELALATAAQFQVHGERFDTMDQRFDGIDKRLDTHDDRLEILAEGMGQLQDNLYDLSRGVEMMNHRLDAIELNTQVTATVVAEHGRDIARLKTGH